MALEYDCTALAPELLEGNDGYITEAIEWYMMFAGMAGELTENNLPELYARIRFIDLMSGGSILTSNAGSTPYTITVDDLRKRIGMKTGVTNRGLSHLNGETRAAFIKRHSADKLDSWVREAKRGLQEAKVAA